MLLRETSGIVFRIFRSYPAQQRGLKFNTFEVVQYAILRVPSSGFRRIIAQITGFTKRNNWNFFQNSPNIPFSRNGAGSEKTRFRTS